MPDSTPIILGYENTKFGTASILMDESLANAVIDSIRFTDHGDSVEEPGNTGHTKTTIDLEDGWDAEVTCLYDSDITWPVKGGTTSIHRPGTPAAVTCDVTKVSGDFGRKATGKISFTARYRPDRAVTPPAP
jgi:hypothetical protein